MIDITGVRNIHTTKKTFFFPVSFHSTDVNCDHAIMVSLMRCLASTNGSVSSNGSMDVKSADLAWAIGLETKMSDTVTQSIKSILTINGQSDYARML